MKLSGSTDVEILDMLRAEGLSVEMAGRVLMQLYCDLRENLADFDATLECFVGILTARDIQNEAAKINDLRARIAAERLRLSWVERLQKLKQGKT